MTKWSDLEDDFRRVVFQGDVDKIAAQIPADRSTVYRLIKGETQNPSSATKAGVERIIDENKRGES